MAETGGGIRTPKRKAKPQLTLVPEEGRAIDYRFEVTLVGEGAKDFALRVIDSEMAEAFYPKGYKPEQDVPASAENGGAMAHSHAEGGKQLVLFCPLGDALEKKGLARIRFVCVETFSDTVPVHTEPTIAANSAIIFLFWRVKDGCLNERLTDFTRVLAEIKHRPVQCRPFSMMHVYKADHEQEEVLREFLKRPLAENVRLEQFDDDGEDMIFDNFCTLCAELVEHSRTVALVPAETAAPGECSKKAASRCCAVS